MFRHKFVEMFIEILLVRSSGVDTRALTAARNVLGQTLIDVDLAVLSNESSSSAVAFIIRKQISAISIVLAWNRLTLVDVVLAMSSIVSWFAIADWRCDIGETHSLVLARFSNTIRVIAESSLEAFAAYACEVVSGCRI